MPNSKGPYFVQVNYHSGFAPHSQQIPVKGWQPGTGASVAGDFLNWDDSLQDADDLMSSLADLFCAFYPPSVVLDNYIVFKQVGTDEIYTPVASGVFISKVGTLTVYVWNEAVEMTFNWRSTNFGLFKIVLLDSASEGTFAKVPSLPASGPIKNLNDELVATSNPFMARDNGRPSAFISRTSTLNEKLRKAYHTS